MIFDSLLYSCLTFIVSIGLALLVWTVLQKGIRNQNIVFGISFVTLLSSLIFLFQIENDILILGENYRCEKLVLVGSNTLKIEGNTYCLQDHNSYNCFVVNKTGKPLVFETFDFGTPSIHILKLDFVNIIEPDSISSKHDFPDYYPWDVPPESVLVPSGQTWARKEWVRYATTAEIEKYHRRKRGF